VKFARYTHVLPLGQSTSSRSAKMPATRESGVRGAGHCVIPGAVISLWIVETCWKKRGGKRKGKKKGKKEGKSPPESSKQETETKDPTFCFPSPALVCIYFAKFVSYPRATPPRHFNAHLLRRCVAASRRRSQAAASKSERPGSKS